MPVTTYDAKKVKVLVGGIPISGFADGTFIKIERENDTFTKVIGADGETSRSKSNDRSGNGTITLLQTSPSNDILNAFMLTDELTNTGVIPFLVQDLSGRSVFVSASAWVKKPPAAEFGKELSTREWVFDLCDLDITIGGNI